MKKVSEEPIKRGRPREKTRTGPGYALANFLDDNWHKCGLTNEEAAIKLDYSSPNIISMFRSGQSKVPLDKLPAIGELIGEDFSTLLPLWMEAELSKRHTERDKTKLLKIVRARFISDNEAPLVDAIRASAKGKDILFSPDTIEAVTKVITDKKVRETVLTASAS